MIRFIGLMLYCGFAIVVAHHDSENPLVQTSNGKIQGSILKTRLGKDLYSFRGVRYGEPPIGRNRFKQAVPVQPHNGIFDATQDAPSCMQPPMYNRTVSEDCLRLNIYTTTLPKHSSDNNSTELKDVVAYLHPGYLMYYSGNTFDVGPDYLLDRDIIFVTINYRLGPLGFMSTGDSRAPGNAGFKDQVLGLKWIKNNIRNFGGNPNSITLMGYNTGATGVSLHMVSPLSKNLFNRAILMSGAATAQKLLPNNLNELAIKEAELLNCPNDLSDSMFDCFYNKSSDAFAHFPIKLDDSIINRSLLYSAVIENINDNSNENQAFLTEQPVDTIREKRAYFVPIIAGVNRDEVAQSIKEVQEQALNGNNTWYDDFNQRFNEIAPKLFDYERNTSRSIEISNELRSFYLNGKPAGVDNFHGLANLFTDTFAVFRVHRFVNLMLNYSSEPVYQYHYVYPGCQTFAKWSNGTNFGVSYYDELILIFKVGFNWPPICEKDLPTQNRLLGIIENFAKTGNPTPPNNSDNLNINWIPSTKDNQQHLVIDSELKMKSGPIFENRMNKMDQIFPL